MAPKKQYTNKEWTDRMAEFRIAKSDLDTLVMNYLIIEGYQNTADKFLKEANINRSHQDLHQYQHQHRQQVLEQDQQGPEQEQEQNESMEHMTELVHANEIVGERMEIKSLIHSGKIQDAIERINDVEPELLDINPDLHFMLLRLQLIELIRSVPTTLDSPLTAAQINPIMDYASAYLSKRAMKDPKYLKDLQDTMALLCIRNPALQDLNLRAVVAHEVNTTLLQVRGLSGESKIKDLIRLWGWAELQLGNEIVVDKDQLFS